MHQTIWGLGNIISEDRKLRDKIMQTGFVNDLVKNLHDLSIETQRTAISTISNMFRYKDPLQISDIKEIVQVLNHFLTESKDDEIIRDCLWSFNYLCNNQNEGIISYLAHQNGIIWHCMCILNQERAKYEIALIKMQSKQRKSIDVSNKKEVNTMKRQAMLEMNDEICRPCLRFLGKILAEPDELTQIVLNAGYLDVIEPWANHFISSQRKEIMWSFSNILAGSHQQIEALISRPELLKSIMDAGQHGMLKVRKAAVWCICNALEGNII